MRTFIPSSEDALASRRWWVIDAKGQPLGRLASRVAAILRGKHKPTFAPHVDGGDFVIVVNAGHVKISGNKATEKIYYRHSGYPGGIKGESLEHLLARRPGVPVEIAVKGMLPKSKLGRHMFSKLKVYSTDKHPHAAQSPAALSL
jgi:large subunit ribosomal protein L13